MLTQEKLKACLHYDPETGVFTRIASTARYVGKPAGHVQQNGYVLMNVCGKRYLAQRLAFLYMTGKWPECIVDHIDHDRANNAWANLRQATYVTNGQNMTRARIDSSTGILGVRKCSNADRYFSQIKVEKKSVYLGCFRTAEEASVAYQAAKRKFHVSQGASA